MKPDDLPALPRSMVYKHFPTAGRPLLRTVWKDGIDLDLPSAALQALVEDYARLARAPLEAEIARLTARVRELEAPRWVVALESALDVGFGDDVRTGGRPELGYALIADSATFSSEDEAGAAIRSASLPIGWVYMPLSRLLPDLLAATPQQAPDTAIASPAVAPEAPAGQWGANMGRLEMESESDPTAPIGTPPEPAQGELSDAEILHRWDTHVGEPTPSRPLTGKDRIEFARAVIAADRLKRVGAGPARTLLEQHDLDQSADYRKGREDGRAAGYEVGYRFARDADAGVRQALAELVAVKDLRETINAQTDFRAAGTFDVHQRQVVEYNRRKPLAWAAAREALAQSQAGEKS